jgi:hypothetical protein
MIVKLLKRIEKRNATASSVFSSGRKDFLPVEPKRLSFLILLGAPRVA